MSETCETVKVKSPVSDDNPLGYIVINASDLNGSHELLDAKAPAKSASEGLTVAEIKDALAAKNIAIPDGVTLKADLAALLDAA